MANNTYNSPFNARYASKEMQYIYSPDFKFKTWRKLWIALAEAEQELGLDITDEQIAELKAHAEDINYEVAQEYEKKFGQLYKRFDVKFIKQNIWNTFETIEEKKEDKEKEKKVDFKAVVTDMSKKMEKNVLDNISTSTCFVCLLHLCNEKSKYNI